MFKVGDTLIYNKGNEQFYILSVTPFNNTFYYVGHFLKSHNIQAVYVFSQKFLKENYKLKPKEKWGIIYTLSNYAGEQQQEAERRPVPDVDIRLYSVTFDSKEKALEIVKQIDQKTKPKIFKIPEDAL